MYVCIKSAEYKEGTLLRGPMAKVERHLQWRRQLAFAPAQGAKP